MAVPLETPHGKGALVAEGERSLAAIKISYCHLKSPITFVSVHTCALHAWLHMNVYMGKREANSRLGI